MAVLILIGHVPKIFTVNAITFVDDVRPRKYMIVAIADNKNNKVIDIEENNSDSYDCFDFSKETYDCFHA